LDLMTSTLILKNADGTLIRPNQNQNHALHGPPTAISDVPGVLVDDKGFGDKGGESTKSRDAFQATAKAPDEGQTPAGSNPDIGTDSFSHTALDESLASEAALPGRESVASCGTLHSAMSMPMRESSYFDDDVFYQGCPSAWAEKVLANNELGEGPDFPSVHGPNPQLGRGLYASKDRAIAMSYAQYNGSDGRLLTFRMQEGAGLKIRDVTEIGKDLVSKTSNDEAMGIVFQHKTQHTMEQACFRTAEACSRLKLESVEAVPPLPKPEISRRSPCPRRL